MDDKKIAKLFKEVRTIQNKTQTEFAQDLGIKQSYLSLIENGEREPKGTLVMAVTEMRNRILKKKSF